MNIEILSLATATPRHAMSQSEALELAQRICCVDDRQARLTRALYRHSGVQNRYSVVPYTEAYRWAPDRGERSLLAPREEVPLAEREGYNGPTTEERMALYQEHALPLAAEAAKNAIHESGLVAKDVTHVVTASCTGFTAPGVDSGLIHELSLPATTQRVHVGYMGCHGSINALRVARGLACAEPRARILVCAVELCSLHYTFHWNAERMLGNALFADGAGAVVLGATAETAPGQTAERWRLAATGSFLFPETADAMTWSVGNHGFAMTISSQLPRLIQEHLGKWLTAWLDQQGLAVADVASWAVHPGGPKIVEAVESAMGLSAVQTRFSRQVLEQYGNMSSATVLFILDALRRSGSNPPCVMLGFGPGLVAEVALLR